jgi:hypothetical protein
MRLIVDVMQIFFAVKDFKSHPITCGKRGLHISHDCYTLVLERIRRISIRLPNHSYSTSSLICGLFYVAPSALFLA